MRGRSADYPAFPEIEAQLGYNPARFLACKVGKHGNTAELSAKGLIRGIQDIETIRAWIEVEVALGRADGGPRRQVITWLNRRQARIEEDRSERAASTARTDDRDQHASPEDERPTDLSEPASDDEAAEPEPAEEPPTTDTIDGDGEDDLSVDPSCPVCGEALTPEHIAGQRGFWCPDCRDFREPVETPPPTPEPEEPMLADGGEETTPRCPDCRAELTPEEIGDETAHWCPFCGGFKERGGTA